MTKRPTQRIRIKPKRFNKVGGQSVSELQKKVSGHGRKPTKKK